MSVNTKRFFIISVDDDAEDQMLFEEALLNTNTKHFLHTLNNGQKLIEFLQDSLKKQKPMPNVIFLDLNMPIKNGKETLQVIKAESSLFRHIPVVVYSTSRSEAEIEACYRLGANLFIVKPDTFPELAKIMKQFLLFFAGVIELPSPLSYSFPE